MTAADLAPIIAAINQTNLFAVMGVCLLSMLTLIELVRLIIVLRRSVKGRMDRV